MSKTPYEVLRGIHDSYRLSTDKALEAIEELEPDVLREFADQLQEIADLLDQTRDAVETAADARDGGVPREEWDEIREAALETIAEVADKIDEVEIPEVFERLALDWATGRKW